MSLTKSVIGVFFGKIGIAVLGFLGMWYAARVVGPSILGVYFLFMTIIRLSSFFTDFGIKKAVVKRISEGNNDKKIFTSSFIILLVLFSITIILFYFLRANLIDYIGNSEVFPFLFIVLFLLSTQNLLMAVLAGNKKVGLSNFTSFLQTAGRVFSWFALLSLGFALVGLIIGLSFGYLVGIGAAIFFLGFNIFKKPGLESFKKIFSFQKFSWIGPIRGRTWNWTDTLVLGFFVAPKFVGVYEVCWSISTFFLFGPIAINNTLFPNVSEIAKKEHYAEIKKVLENSMVYIGLLVFPGLIGAIVLGKSVLRIYGNEFIIGSTILVILILSRLIEGYEKTFSRVLDGLDYPNLTLKSNIIFITSNIIGNVFLIYFIGWIGAAIATSFSITFALILNYNYLKNIIDFEIPKKEIVLEVSSAIIMGIILHIMKHIISLPLKIRIPLLVIFGFVFYISLLIAMSEKIRLKMVAVIREINEVFYF
ncbi:hypothetical protein C9439_04000 [archaeon SCG-AAA382B04]|nr:hypothetical protein C9439_04000 [archaeon SCG-AAA382B04]